MKKKRREELLRTIAEGQNNNENYIVADIRKFGRSFVNKAKRLNRFTNQFKLSTPATPEEVLDLYIQILKEGLKD